MTDNHGAADRQGSRDFIYCEDGQAKNIAEMEKRIRQIKETLASKDYQKKLKRKDSEAENLIAELLELQKKRSTVIGEAYNTSSHTKTIRDDLLNKLEAARQNIDAMIDSKLAEVFMWKYATGEYFHPLPYHAEIHDYKRGRVLKNIKENERFNKRDVHSYGYNESGQLIIKQYSNTNEYKKYGVATEIYTTNADESMDSYYVSRWFQDKECPSELDALGVYRPLTDGSWIKVGVGSNKINWSATHYIYDESNRVERVIIGTLHGGNPSWWFYDFAYDEEGQLEKIMVGDYVRWERIKNPSSKRI